MIDPKLMAAPTETRERTIEDVKPRQLYRHFKGHVVRVLAVSTDTETGKLYVVYRHMGERRVWHRPVEMFLSEVDHERYPEVHQKYRFELIKTKKSKADPGGMMAPRWDDDEL